jgi:site-specific recombinase XerD
MSSKPSLSESFIQHGIYLRNWSKLTVRTYRVGLGSLGQELPTKEQLEAWIRTLRERGLTPSGCNTYIRPVNSYLSWLHEQGHIPSPLRLKKLRAPLLQKTLLSNGDIKALLMFKPKRHQRRVWTLVLLLLDTGVRVDEALSIRREKVNLDEMTLVVWGKGAKERVVPFSMQMRKILFRYLQQSPEGTFLFCAKTGSRLMHRNVYRAIQALVKKAGITTHCHPHLFRHQFAANYIRQGGDIYRLSRLLGHTSVNTTQLYLRSLGVEDIRAGQDRLTPLNQAP